MRTGFAFYGSIRWQNQNFKWQSILNYICHVIKLRNLKMFCVSSVFVENETLYRKYKHKQTFAKWLQFKKMDRLELLIFFKYIKFDGSNETSVVKRKPCHGLSDERYQQYIEQTSEECN